MGKVIFNADDFGYSRGINYGIVDSFKHGILTSTTLMANMPGFEHAVELAKENPDLGIGVHLTLTTGEPVLKTHKTLITKDGRFRELSVYEADTIDVDFDEVYQEWKAQIQKVINAGIKPTHLDSHHHTHTFGGNQEVVKKLAREYDLPIRNNLELPDDIKKTTRFEVAFENCCSESSELRARKYLENLLEDLQRFESVEIMCHPGYLDEGVLLGSSLQAPRTSIARFLRESEFAQKIITMDGIELVNYSAI